MRDVAFSIYIWNVNSLVLQNRSKERIFERGFSKMLGRNCKKALKHLELGLDKLSDRFFGQKYI